MPTGQNTRINYSTPRPPKAEQLTFTSAGYQITNNQKNLCIAQRFFFMKLGLEVDPQADHPPLGSDRNPRFYLLRNTGLVDANLFAFPAWN